MSGWSMGTSKNNASNIRWQGKKWGAVGDSITAGAYTTKTYWQYISSMVGCNVINYGVSGSGWRNPSGYGGGDAIYQRIGSIDSTCDLVTVFAGTNDWNENYVSMNLGSLGDTSGATSLYGAIDQTLSTLVTNFPTKTIAVFTPLQRSDAWYNLQHTCPNVWAASQSKTAGNQVVPTVANGYSYICNVGGTTGATQPTWPTSIGATVTDGTVTWKCYAVSPSGVTMQDVSNAIIQVANKYNIPVLDLYKLGNIYAQNSTFKSSYMPDGLHPNATLHQLLANKILTFLNSL